MTVVRPVVVVVVVVVVVADAGVDVAGVGIEGAAVAGFEGKSSGEEEATATAYDQLVTGRGWLEGVYG